MVPPDGDVWNVQMAPSGDSTAGQLGHRIHVRRVDLRMSREQLAHASRLHPTYIGDIERGQRDPKVTTLLRLARALRTTPGALIDDLDPDT